MIAVARRFTHTAMGPQMDNSTDAKKSVTAPLAECMLQCRDPRGPRRPCLLPHTAHITYLAVLGAHFQAQATIHAAASGVQHVFPTTESSLRGSDSGSHRASGARLAIRRAATQSARAGRLSQVARPPRAVRRLMACTPMFLGERVHSARSGACRAIVESYNVYNVHAHIRLRDASLPTSAGR